MSLKPGVGVHAEVTNPPAKATGVIQNPMTPVEYGRTAEKSKYTVTDSALPLPDYQAGGPAGTTLTGLTVNGDLTASNGDTKNYTTNVAGTNVSTSDGTFLWEVSGGTATIGSPAASGTSITFNEVATFTVTCTYTDANATGSPVSQSVTVVVS